MNNPYRRCTGSRPRKPLANDQQPTTNDSVYVSDIFAHTELLAAPVFEADLASEKTRPNLKVQDGCNNRCTFCVIPYVRGSSRSLPLGEVLREADALVAAGYRELVLSGINLGRWGRDLGELRDLCGADDLVRARRAELDVVACSATALRRRLRLPDLIRALLDRTAIEKLRISSVEPMDWTDELIELVATSPRIARHAHVPMQSGSDRVLRRMARRYRPWHYADRIRRVHAARPEAAIGADVMVGFPGETEAEFEETRSLIAALPFTYLHVFTFSARPGTPGATMPNQVPVQIARERNRILRELASKKNLRFRQSLVGREVKAITLERSERASGFTHALSDNYIKMKIAGDHHPNRWMQVQVTDVDTDGLTAVTVTGSPFDASSQAFAAF